MIRYLLLSILTNMPQNVNPPKCSFIVSQMKQKHEERMRKFEAWLKSHPVSEDKDVQWFQTWNALNKGKK